MEIIVHDGKTIIKTGIGRDAVKNKTGVKGLTYREESNNYSLAIVYNGKKYHIGNYKTIEEAKSIRTKADEHIEHGTFLQWADDYMNKRVTNSYGVKGLFRKPGHKNYQLTISYKSKKYFVGSFAEVEDAKVVRETAEVHMKDGTFPEWVDAFKKNRKESGADNE